MLHKCIYIYEGFPDGSDGKESAFNTGDLRSIPGSRRSPGEGNGCPLQHSRLENSMNRGAWWATVSGVTIESDTTERRTLYLGHTHTWTPPTHLIMVPSLNSLL